MNHNLQQLHAYPFAKMASLLANSEPNPDYTEIKLGIGEPKHEPPAFVLEVIKNNVASFGRYPTTSGSYELRQTIAHWLERRFFLRHINTNTEVLPVMGSREAIFSFVQAVIDQPVETARTSENASSLSTQTPIVVMPNPFYQIYEGAAILAQAMTRLLSKRFMSKRIFMPWWAVIYLARSMVKVLDKGLFALHWLQA